MSSASCLSCCAWARAAANSQEPKTWCGGSVGEPVAEHRQPADGLGLGRLVLSHVPVLGELAAFDANDVGGDPGGGAAIAGEGPVCGPERWKIRLEDTVPPPRNCCRCMSPEGGWNMDEDDGNRIPNVSHLTQRQSSLRRFPIMQRRMRRTSESLSFLTVWWCRRLLMQVEETAAEPAETRPAWSAFSIFSFCVVPPLQGLFCEPLWRSSSPCTDRRRHDLRRSLAPLNRDSPPIPTKRHPHRPQRGRRQQGLLHLARRVVQMRGPPESPKNHCPLKLISKIP
jgi:hypothetical protein